MFEKTVASREKLKLMIGLTGPSGSGKTYSALQLAYGITGDWSKITVADTENKSALYYANLGRFGHVDFNGKTIPGGYSPRNWIKLIESEEKDPKTEVLVLDSITHEWEGFGGCLEMVDAAGKFNGWKTVTPMHRAFIDAMRNSRLHIIATMRSKQDYVVETNDKGRSTPKKIGTKANQREGTDYEFGLVFDVEMSHYATASKDRTGLFAGRGPFMVTPDLGKEPLKWADAGTKVKPTTEASLGNSSETYDNKNKTHKEWLMGIFKNKKTPQSLWKAVAEGMEGAEMTGANVEALILTASAFGTGSSMTAKPGSETGSSPQT